MPPVEAAPDAELIIVLNAASGSDAAEAVRDNIERVLTEGGRAYKLLLVRDSARLREIARQAVGEAAARHAIVVAAGGDGTINAVAQAVLGSGCAFGVLPQGTFNYFSREHGIPSDTVAATRLLLDGRVEPVQAGLVNERIFLVNASLGLYPKLLEDREFYKRQYGRHRLVAFGAGLLTLLRVHRRLRLHLDDRGTARELRTTTLFVGNNRLQLERIGLAEAEAPTRGRLAAVTLRPVGTLGMVGLVLRGLLGRLGQAEEVDSSCFEQMSVKVSAPYALRRVKVATDGEIVWLRSPLVFRVAPEPLYLIKPRFAPGAA